MALPVGSEASRIGSGPFLRTLATVVIALGNQLLVPEPVGSLTACPDHCIALLAVVSSTDRPNARMARSYRFQCPVISRRGCCNVAE
jgi:hypothetical protein